MTVRWRGVFVVAGGVLVHLTLGTIYTFGNLTPYLTSYIRIYSSPSTLTYTESVWIYALACMGQGTSMFIGGLLMRKLGPRISTLIGGWTMSLGVILTYFSVKASFGVCMVTYGLMSGLGVGVAYAVPMACGMKWLPEKKGLVNGFVVAGFGGGAFIFDQVQTHFINPDNYSPDKTDHQSKYFTQDSVLQKVPPCFLLLGGCYAAMQLVGSLLLSLPPESVSYYLSNTRVFVGVEWGLGSIGFLSHYDPEFIIEKAPQNLRLYRPPKNIMETLVFQKFISPFLYLMETRCKDFWKDE